LKEELDRLNLLDGIPTETLRLHQRPSTTLKDNEYLASLLPPNIIERVAVIYCHVKVTVGEDLSGVAETSPVVTVGTWCRRWKDACSRIFLSLASALSITTGRSTAERCSVLLQGFKDAFWILFTGEHGDEDHHDDQPTPEEVEMAESNPALCASNSWRTQSEHPNCWPIEYATAADEKSASFGRSLRRSEQRTSTTESHPRPEIQPTRSSEASLARSSGEMAVPLRATLVSEGQLPAAMQTTPSGRSGTVSAEDQPLPEKPLDRVGSKQKPYVHQPTNSFSESK